jgi:MoaA/NifB/PqqE/SkfB family radical SAM enzyme
MTYIDPRGKVFAHPDRLARWAHGERPAPVTVEWDLSNRCSLGCFRCHFAHTHTKGPWTMKARTLPMAFDDCGDLADLDLVCRVLPELKAAGVQAIVWSGGGEPTLHPEWTLAIDAAHKAGLQQGLYTLGGHLSPGTAAFLSDRLRWVVVSLDAADSLTYASEKGVATSRFDAACSGIRWLADADGPCVVGVSFLLHAGNWRQATAMLWHARGLGASYATFRPTIEFDAAQPNMPSQSRHWIAEALPSLALLAQEPDVELDVSRFVAYRDWQGHGYGTCYGIRLTATITPDGRVWVCPNRRGMTDSLLGDLRREAFAALWARHPGQWTDFANCRVMCRLHPVNQTLAAVYQPRQHEAFV